MSTFVLVHGSWHGGWCWNRLVPLLEQAGHRVLAPDLAGLGDDHTPPGNVTLSTWTDAIGRLIDAESEPVILVGHSRGGIVISQVAEAQPRQIACLVYLAAFLPRDGESVIQLAQTDIESLILPNLTVNEAAGYTFIDLGRAPEIFYNTSPQADIDRAVQLLRPEPAAPTFTPLTLTDDNFGTVPRIYIRTQRDQTLGPLLQERMLAGTPCQQVLSLDTDHSPFFSAPRQLADQLLGIAAAHQPAATGAVPVPAS
jgi:pimeloyl-ACP methyl ester carboxylesterase